MHGFFLACLIAFYPLVIHKQLHDNKLVEEKILVVNKGDSLRIIANELAKQGVIKNQVLFEFFARLYNLDREIKSGEYYVNTSQSIQDILSDLSLGSVINNRITFPEGASS